MKSIDITVYIAVYSQVLFYILYIVYRSTIYISFIAIPIGVIRVLKKTFPVEDKDEDDISIYSRDVREIMLDDDELSPMEEAFMNGYEDAV